LTMANKAMHWHNNIYELHSCL